MCAASQAVMYLVSVRPEAVNPCTILVGSNDFVKKKKQIVKSHIVLMVYTRQRTPYTLELLAFIYTKIINTKK